MAPWIKLTTVQQQLPLKEPKSPEAQGLKKT